MRTVYSLSTKVIKLYMKLAGNYEVTGKEHLRDQRPCIIAANHLSYYDPPFIGAVLGKEIHYLAKSELFNIRLIGKFLRYYNATPVRRGVIDRDALNDVKSLLHSGESILLFPEGSRKSFTAKPGIGLLVYETGVHVLPVKIENSHRMMKCLLRKEKLRIKIGEMTNTSSYQQLPAGKETYRKIAKDVLDKVNSL